MRLCIKEKHSRKEEEAQSGEQWTEKTTTEPDGKTADQPTTLKGTMVKNSKETARLIMALLIDKLTPPQPPVHEQWWRWLGKVRW